MAGDAFWAMLPLFAFAGTPPAEVSPSVPLTSSSPLLSLALSSAPAGIWGMGGGLRGAFPGASSPLLLLSLLESSSSVSPPLPTLRPNSSGTGRGAAGLASSSFPLSSSPLLAACAGGGDVAIFASARACGVGNLAADSPPSAATALAGAAAVAGASATRAWGSWPSALRTRRARFTRTCELSWRLAAEAPTAGAGIAVGRGVDSGRDVDVVRQALAVSIRRIREAPDKDLAYFLKILK